MEEQLRHANVIAAAFNEIGQWNIEHCGLQIGNCGWRCRYRSRGRRGCRRHGCVTRAGDIHNNLASYLYRYLFLNLYGYLTRHLDWHRYLAGDFDGYHLIACGTGNAGHDGNETCQNCTAG